MHQSQSQNKPLRVLISGAGIAGGALAFWLGRLGHNVTVVERYDSLRDAGLQIDVRGVGIEVLRKMGLEDAFRAKSVREEGISIVDDRGRQWAFFGANRSGKGAQSFTSDFEIMRGDLCHILYDASKDRVRYVFGTTVQSCEDGDQGIDVVFSDGTTDRFDLLVGADGQGSRTRKMILQSDAPDPLQLLGVCSSYFKMARPMREDDRFVAKAYMATGYRGMLVRRHSPDEMQATLVCSSSGPMGAATKGDVEEEKAALAEAFQGAGWETDRILQAMAQADDFYCERLGLVKMDCWSRGHVTLVGDAGYCPSALTGMGTTAALVGAYVLAGEIGRHCPPDSNANPIDDIPTALKTYEERLRPFTTQLQKGLSDGGMNGWSIFPTSSWGIYIFHWLIAAFAFLRLDLIAQAVIREDNKGWVLPEYDEMVKTV